MNWLIIITGVLAAALLGGLVFVGSQRQLNRQPYWRRVIVVAALLVLATLAGLLPLRSLDPNQLTADSDIIFVVDTTYSMNALDGRDGDTRLTDATRDLRTFGEALGGSRIGIVTYDKKANIYLPLTTTYSDVDTAADTLSAGAYMYSNDDPSLTGALTYTKDYLQKVQAADTTRHQVVVLMSDGELTGETDSPDSVKAAAEQLAQLADAAVVIGYGTNEGAKMPEISMSFSGDGALVRHPTRFAKGIVDGRYIDIVSKRNEPQLQAIATSLRGTYIPAQNISQATSTLTAARQQAAAQKAASPESQATRQNLLHVPLAIGILAWIVVTEVLAISRVREFIGSWRRP